MGFSHMCNALFILKKKIIQKRRCKSEESLNWVSVMINELVNGKVLSESC